MPERIKSFTWCPHVSAHREVGSCDPALVAPIRTAVHVVKEAEEAAHVRFVEVVCIALRDILGDVVGLMKCRRVWRDWIRDVHGGLAFLAISETERVVRKILGSSLHVLYDN
jgi:hypothetical protein